MELYPSQEGQEKHSRRKKKKRVQALHRGCTPYQGSQHNLKSATFRVSPATQEDVRVYEYHPSALDGTLRGMNKDRTPKSDNTY